MIRKIGDVLRQYLEEKGWTMQDPGSAVFLRWSEIAGEELAAHSQPVEIEEGTLIVDADHPGWAQMLSLRKTEILRSIKKAAPGSEIEAMRIRLERGTRQK